MIRNFKHLNLQIKVVVTHFFSDWTWSFVLLFGSGYVSTLPEFNENCRSTVGKQFPVSICFEPKTRQNWRQIMIMGRINKHPTLAHFGAFTGRFTAGRFFLYSIKLKCMKRNKCAAYTTLILLLNTLSLQQHLFSDLRQKFASANFQQFLLKINAPIWMNTCQLKYYR